MTIYSNGTTVRLPIADGMPPLTAPLIQPIPCTDGVRGYILGPWKPNTRHVIVAASGHWYNTGDQQPTGRWSCRSCPATGQLADLIDRTFARCPKPASGQDIATALLGRQVVSA